MTLAIHEAVARRAQAGDLSITAAGVADIDRMLAEERARHHQADGAGCVGEGVAAHTEENACAAR